MEKTGTGAPRTGSLLAAASGMGRHRSVAEVEGWSERSLDSLYERDEGVTAVGSTSVAQALITIRRRAALEDDAHDQHSSPTLRPTEPAPPDSDIREIGSSGSARERRGEDPLARYFEALDLPAVEIRHRPRHETVKMMPARRQVTLMMIDRPLPPPPLPRASAAPQRALRTTTPAYVVPLLIGIVIAVIGVLAYVRVESI